MSAWLLLGWLALYPSERFGVATFTTREDCEARAIWLAEPSRKRSLRREYACVEVPTAGCSGASWTDAQGVSTTGGGGLESLEPWGVVQRAGVKRDTWQKSRGAS